jgi:hypothetical protein
MLVGTISPVMAEAAVSMIFLRFSVISLMLLIPSKYQIADAAFDLSIGGKSRDYP